MQTGITVDGMAGNVNFNNGIGVVDFKNDVNVNVMFYPRPVLDQERSRALGRPVHMACEYVRIQQPGERDTIDRPVTDSDKQRWPNKWAQFIANKEQVPSGTQVECLFPAHPEIPANLHTMGVHTVEQLAHLTEEAASQVGMGATQWRNMAKSFLANANKGVEFHQMQKELESRDTQIATMANQMAMMKTQLDRLAAASNGVPVTMIQSAETLPQAQLSLPMEPAFDAEYEAAMALLNAPIKPTFGDS